MARRSIKNGKTDEALDTLSGPKRDRSYEAEQRAKGIVVTYRGIPPELQADIKAVAGALRVPIGDVARAFLAYGLAAYRRGDLELSPVETVRKATLYPDRV